MKQVIDAFRNRPGEHCGSTAMRNLLHHYYGLDLEEGVVFGLGAGIDFYLLPLDLPMLTGRSVSLEQDAGVHLGIEYNERFEPDDDKAWQAVRSEVLLGKPVMLTGDIFYLDYREFKVHYPAHRFVLVGFDDDAGEAYIMDRIKATFETCSLEALGRSRNPGRGISTFNLWGRFEGPFEAIGSAELKAACRAGLATNAARMTGKLENRSLLMQGLRMQYGLESGLSALEQLPDRIAEWRTSDSGQKIAAFNANCIEKYGTGGGLFRKLYSDFLDFTHARYPDLVTSGDVSSCREAAEKWTALAALFRVIGEGGDEAVKWEAATELSGRIAALESKLFFGLNERLGMPDNIHNGRCLPG